MRSVDLFGWLLRIISGNSNMFILQATVEDRVLSCCCKHCVFTFAMCLYLLTECYVFIFTNRVLLSILKQARVHLLDTEPFEDAFGPKTKRKRPKLLAADYESWAKKADGSQGI